MNTTKCANRHRILQRSPVARELYDRKRCSAAVKSTACHAGQMISAEVQREQAWGATWRRLAEGTADDAGQ